MYRPSASEVLAISGMAGAGPGPRNRGVTTAPATGRPVEVVTRPITPWRIAGRSPFIVGLLTGLSSASVPAPQPLKHPSSPTRNPIRIEPV